MLSGVLEMGAHITLYQPGELRCLLQPCTLNSLTGSTSQVSLSDVASQSSWETRCFSQGLSKYANKRRDQQSGIPHYNTPKLAFGYSQYQSVGM